MGVMKTSYSKHTLLNSSTLTEKSTGEELNVYVTIMLPFFRKQQHE
jgi:hypothetical protein